MDLLLQIQRAVRHSQAFVLMGEQPTNHDDAVESQLWLAESNPSASAKALIEQALALLPQPFSWCLPPRIYDDGSLSLKVYYVDGQTRVAVNFFSSVLRADTAYRLNKEAQAVTA